MFKPFLFLFFLLITMSGVPAYGEIPVDQDLEDLAWLWCSDYPDTKKHLFDDFLGNTDRLSSYEKGILFEEKFAEALLMRTPELKVFGTNGTFNVYQAGVAALSCPPHIGFEGSFYTKDGKYYGFSLHHDTARTYDYKINNMSLPSPLKQHSAGIDASDIVCKDGLNLIINPNGNPFCVTYNTLQKLVERNKWHVPSS